MKKINPYDGPFQEGKPKTGRLTAKEKKYIAEYHKIRAVDDIAKTLNRFPSTIREYIKEITVPQNADLPELVQQVIQKTEVPSAGLRMKPEWLQLCAQFDPDELKHFECKYNELIKQFDNDVTATEELQIIHLIKLELLTNRILVDIRKLDKDQRRMRKRLSDYRKLGDLNETDRENLARMEEGLSAVLSIAHGKNQEYIKLDAEYVKQMREIKGTRDQRLKEIESRKENWMALMKSVSDREFAEQEGLMLAKVQAAVEKERGRLSEYHQYGDGILDQPILSSETIKEDYDK